LLAFHFKVPVVEADRGLNKKFLWVCGVILNVRTYKKFACSTSTTGSTEAVDL